MCARSAAPRAACLAVFAAAAVLFPIAHAAQVLNSGDTVSRVDSDLTVWDADYGFDLSSSAVLFDPNNLWTPEASWPAPSRDLYSHARVAANAGANLSYTLATAAYGTYTLRLHFCELDETVGEAGLRVFDVAVNGVAVLSSLDIVETFGWATPGAMDFDVEVVSSQLRVELRGALGSQMPALLSGLELHSAGACPKSSQSCASLGWSFRHGHSSVCSESVIFGVCNTDNFTNAVDTCREIGGGRLCTAAELELDAAGGSGCGFDSTATWTSDGCTGGGRITAAGATTSNTTNPRTCMPISTVASVRCCADVQACAAALPATTTTTAVPLTTMVTTVSVTTTPSCLVEQSTRSCTDLMREDNTTNNVRDPWKLSGTDVCGMSPQVEVLNGSVMEWHCVKSSLPGPNGYAMPHFPMSLTTLDCL